MEVQKNRNHREQETIYKTLKEIPPNPKEPWDIEMDYDDSLTPVIPTEQPPDTDCTETQPSHRQEVNNAAETLVPPPQGVNSVVLPPTNTASSTAEPDLELLAVLLKNPELVFALTSGQAANLSSEDTVKLLDMIKAGGAGFAGSLNGLASKMEEKVEVSLPSPTPSSNPGTVRYSGSLCNFSQTLYTLHSSFSPAIYTVVSSFSFSFSFTFSSLGRICFRILTAKHIENQNDNLGGTLEIFAKKYSQLIL